MTTMPGTRPALGALRSRPTIPTIEELEYEAACRIHSIRPTVDALDEGKMAASPEILDTIAQIFTKVADLRREAAKKYTDTWHLPQS